MRARFALILFLLGVLTLIGQAFERSIRERQFFELSLLQKREAIAQGLAAKWREHLLVLARKGDLPRSYSLIWNRAGSSLLTPFFPVHKATLNWEEYRQKRTKKDPDGQRKFLRSALQMVKSWDRTLAIQEWALHMGPIPEDIKLSPYERALVDPEAREAFARIFELFESGRDFTFARKETEFDRVFFHVTGDGQIESYVPSARDLGEQVLPEFLKVNNISSARLGFHPWDIHFDVVQDFAPPSSLLSAFVSAIALVLVGGGVALYWLSLRDQKTALLKRVTFLNQVVHELKTPLAGLKLHVQLIKRFGPSQTTLDAVDESVGRMDRLFDDIVLINRSTNQADLGMLNLEWLHQLARSWAEEFPGKVEIIGNFRRQVFSEKKRLTILFRNLLGNAVKYGERATIEIDDSGPYTEISIQDNGPGISVAESRLIFEEFYRADAAKTKSADGLGLGLALVKKLADELQARVVLSNPGERCARFTVSLPKEKS